MASNILWPVMRVRFKRYGGFQSHKLELLGKMDRGHFLPGYGKCETYAVSIESTDLMDYGRDLATELLD